MQPETFTTTYAEVMEKLLTHPELHQKRKGELRSAVKTFVKRFVPAGMGTVIVPRDVSAIVTKATPAKAGLRESSFANMISRLRVALKLCSIIVQPSRHTTGLDEPWATLFKQVTESTMRSRLSRFFHTASRYGWKPEEINGAHFHQFHQELDQNAILKNAHRLAQDAAKAWNKLAAINLDLPSVDFALPKKREPYTFSWDKYPESLGHEVRQVIQKMACPEIMAEEHRPPLRPTTLRLWEFRLRQFAAGLVHGGRKHADLIGLKDLCNLAAYRDGLMFFRNRAGGNDKSRQVLGLAQTMYTISKHHTDTDPAELAMMQIILKRLSDLHKKGMTEKNKRRLAQFDNPRLRDGLLHLPLKLALTARTNRTSGRFSKERAAAMMMTAVAIELLLFTLLRIRNLASLDLDRHVRRFQVKGVLSTHLFIPEEETKNGVEIYCELPQPTARMLEEYIDQFRPDLPMSAPSSLLFPATNGGLKGSGTFWWMITTATREYLGVEINPHLFRHLGAKLYLDQHPGGYEVVRRALGHKSIDTTVRYYAGQETARSFRHFDQTILKQREEAGRRPSRDDSRRKR